MSDARKRGVGRLSCASVVVSVGVLLGSAASVLAQPANNQCANATIVVDGSYNGTTVGATNDGSATCGSSSSSPDVWYRYTAPYNGTMTANTCAAANYDTVISVWSGCPGVGAQLACDDDLCGNFRSTVTINITNGQQYLIRVAGYLGATGTFTLTVTSQQGGGGGTNGPDVVFQDLTSVAAFGPINNTRAYITDSYTCNMGDTALQWGGVTPLMTWNAYRLHNGRFEQIGMSWAKNGTTAAATSGCGPACQGGGGSILGAGCRDFYGSGYNSGQSIFGPRSQINAFTGAYPGASGSCAVDAAICKRLQIREADMSATSYPNAQYFFEVVFVAPDDAAAGNAMNNASHKRVTISPTYVITPSGSMAIGRPAIEAWRDHGLGPGVPDSAVQLATLDVPGEGRFHTAYKVTDLGGGQHLYEYAVFNLNSHRSGGSFNVPIPPGVVVTNVGFHDTFYHSGEPFDNSDWTAVVDANGVTWSSPQTFAQNPNSNALRYGTLYNFRFEANAGPSNGTVTLGLFRPGTPASVTATMAVPMAPAACALLGDVNVDTQINGIDVGRFVDCMLNGSTPGGNCDCADMDDSGTIDDTDVMMFVGALVAP